VHDLRERGSIVLIDAPPLLGIADAHFMAALADGVVLVTSAGKERPSEVRAALDSLELLDANLLGVVLNHAKTEFAPAYGYYGHGRRGRAGRRLGGSPSAESSLESADV
jgi:Mrp family chromosome partitioning ATPase